MPNKTLKLFFLTIRSPEAFFFSFFAVCIPLCYVIRYVIEVMNYYLHNILIVLYTIIRKHNNYNNKLSANMTFLYQYGDLQVILKRNGALIVYDTLMTAVCDVM